MRILRYIIGKLFTNLKDLANFALNDFEQREIRPIKFLLLFIRCILKKYLSLSKRYLSRTSITYLYRPIIRAEKFCRKIDGVAFVRNLPRVIKFLYIKYYKRKWKKILTRKNLEKTYVYKLYKNYFKKKTTFLIFIFIIYFTFYRYSYYYNFQLYVCPYVNYVEYILYKFSLYHFNKFLMFLKIYSQYISILLILLFVVSLTIWARACGPRVRINQFNSIVWKNFFLSLLTIIVILLIFFNFYV